MSSEDFIKLYYKQIVDEKIVPIIDATGFTIVRYYPEGSDYSIKGKRMFIKLYLSNDNFVNGGIDMVEPDSQRG